ncbi:MAG: nuclear transport factor 2 family protein [Bacteroidota bacterium]
MEKTADSSAHSVLHSHESLEKFEIFQMAYKFADAANRKDSEMFQSLWDHEQAEWIIGPPINVSFRGKENMRSSVEHMLDRWEFFVQLVTGGVVILDGDKAYARFYVNEIANSKEGTGNHNLSMYEDELIKREENWFFTKRIYHTIFQSSERQLGEMIGVPQIPGWLRAVSLDQRT